MAAKVPSELMHFVGQHSQDITTAIGVIVNGHAPLDVNRWDDITYQTKEFFIECMKVKL